MGQNHSVNFLVGVGPSPNIKMLSPKPYTPKPKTLPPKPKANRTLV